MLAVGDQNCENWDRCIIPPAELLTNPFWRTLYIVLPNRDRHCIMVFRPTDGRGQLNPGTGVGKREHPGWNGNLGNGGAQDTMAVRQDIQRLCESWWRELANVARDEYRQFAVQFLGLHGWHKPSLVKTRGTSQKTAALSFLVHDSGPAPFAAHFVPRGVIDPPKTLIDDGLDFCPATRALASDSQALGVQYAFITDLFKSYLYDVQTEELLLHANTPEDYVTEFGELLTEGAVSNGSLEEVRRQPRSFAARQLREWMQRWCDTLTMNWGVPEDTILLFMDRLIVLRYVLEHGMIDLPGWCEAKPLADILNRMARGASIGCGAEVIALFHHVARTWDATLFDRDESLEALFGQDEVAGPLLQEFGMLSKGKFDTAIVLEQFNYGDATEKARVRMIPEEDPERSTVLGRQRPGTIDKMNLELDVAEEGYRSLLHWFDRITDVYNRIDSEQQEASSVPLQVEEDAELFGWSDDEPSPGQTPDNPFRRVMSQGLAVYCASDRQFRTARLLLYLHIIEQYKRTRTPFARFPDVERALRPRPVVLEADRRQIYGTARHSSEWEAI